MSKIRIIITATREYEPNPKWYPEGSTLEDMAKMDCKLVKEDPHMFIDGTKDIKVSYEIVEK